MALAKFLFAEFLVFVKFLLANKKKKKPFDQQLLGAVLYSVQIWCCATVTLTTHTAR